MENGISYLKNSSLYLYSPQNTPLVLQQFSKILKYGLYVYLKIPKIRFRITASLKKIKG